MPPNEPNLLVLMSDQHNYQYLGHHSPSGEGKSVNTPTLDDIAGSGTTFESAYAPVPSGTPFRIATLAGRSVHNCGA